MEGKWHEGVEVGRYRGYLKDFVEKLKTKTLPVEVNPLSCNAGCALHGVMDVLSCVQGVTVVVHGPIGCSYIMGTAVKIRWGETTAGGMIFTVVSTGFNEIDVIMGGENKLKEVILRVDKELKPKLIVVLTTCATGVTGEDIEGVVDNIKDQVEAIVTAVHSAGFTCRHQGKGYDMAYSLLIDEFMEEPKEKIPMSINVIGDKRARTGTRLNLYEMKRILDKIKVKLNKSFVTSGSTIDDIKAVPLAEYNTIYCINSGNHPAKHLYEKFKMPFSVVPLPVGLEATKEWYLDICDFFNLGKKERDIIEEEYQRTKKQLEEPMKVLKGKKFGLDQNIHRAINLASYASELGMDVVYMAAYYARELGANEFVRLIERTGINPFVLVEPTWAEEEAVISKLKPDLFLGEPSMSLWVYNAGGEFDGIEQHPGHGFAGAINLAQRWARLIAQRPYRRIKKWVDLPPHSNSRFIKRYKIESPAFLEKVEDFVREENRDLL